MSLEKFLLGCASVAFVVGGIQISRYASCEAVKDVVVSDVRLIVDNEWNPAFDLGGGNYLAVDFEDKNYCIVFDEDEQIKKGDAIKYLRMTGSSSTYGCHDILSFEKASPQDR